MRNNTLLIIYRMNKNDLRIVFMGTPDFAVPTLEAIVAEGYDVVAVVTQPDRPVGRHGSVRQPSPVKQCAIAHGIPVLQPEKMRDAQFVECLRSYNANLQVVVAFRMLPYEVWAMPEYGTFNVHASLLPQYRGAAPINWALINGETRTGITTFFLDRQIDTGRIIMQVPFEIAEEYDAGDVHDALMRLGASVCLSTIAKIIDADGHPASVPQASLSTHAEPLHPAPKIFNETCKIDWTLPAKRINDFIRGLSPHPGAWTTLTAPDGKRGTLKIYKASVAMADDHCSIAGDSAGTIIAEGKVMRIVAGDGNMLTVRELQLSGKRRMSAADFLNGNKHIEDCHIG